MSSQELHVFDEPLPLVACFGMAEEGEAGFAFGGYRLFPKRWLLLAGDRPVPLGSRAFQVLLALVEAGGELVTKDEIRKRVWPITTVEPQNVDIQIHALRKALGSDRDMIRTDTGRGFRLAAEVRVIPGAGSAPEFTPVPAAEPVTNLPTPISPLIGREQELAELQELIAGHRLVTLSGAGGIGKTQLGFEVARRVVPHFGNGVWIVELASLTDEELVPGAIARVLGIEPGSSRSVADQLILAIQSKRLLLVLDNCEHVIEAVASITETLLRGVPGLHVLATSQEPLAAEGERVYRVSPLKVPLVEGNGAAGAAAYSAVQLFVERAQAADPSFALDDLTTPAVIEICRHLDGMPLAIELAAARVATIGVTVLAARLDDRFRLLTGGRRKALKRHQTLSATLDWSYGLLAEPERAVLRRIAIFAGRFSLDGASAVAAVDGIDASEAANHVAALVSKSLATFENSGPLPRYRLLDTTRAYALEKLAESGEFDVVARRHADYYRALLEGAEASWQTTPAAALVARYAPELDDIRAALKWAFEANGDAEIGVALAAASAPLWMLLSMFSQCRDLVREALSHLGEPSLPQTAREMRLQAALGTSSMWSDGPVSATREASQRALKLAEELQDTEYELQALYTLWVYHLRNGEHRASLAFAQRFRRIAEHRCDLPAILAAARVEGVSLFYLGDFTSARAAMEHVVASTSPEIERFAVRFGKDQRVTALVYLLRILWHQGFPDQALRMTRRVVAEAQTLSHANSLCCALDGACGIVALSGDAATLEEFAAALTDCAEKHGLAMWRALGLAFRAVVAVRRGEPVLGLRLLRSTFVGSRAIRVELRHTVFVETLIEASVAAGSKDDGLTMAQELLDEALLNDGRCCVPEMLRLRGELALYRGVPAPADLAAEKDFAEALDIAGRQGAHMWRLRAATSLARLLQRRGERSEARNLLLPIHERFTEGFATADLRAARALINHLQ